MGHSSLRPQRSRECTEMMYILYRIPMHKSDQLSSKKKTEAQNRTKYFDI